MAYRDKPTSATSAQIDSISLTKKMGGGSSVEGDFYEIEPGLVLDIILDKDHPYFKKKPFTISNDKWPADINGEQPKNTDPDYTWMGRTLVRMLYTQRNLQKEDLVWALPLDGNISEYPLVNEVVGIVSYLGQYYYTRKINSFNLPNVNADFNVELVNGGFRKTPESPIQGNRELLLNKTDTYKPFEGPTSKMKYKGGNGYEGALGRYFTFNPRIRSIKRREGDFVLESRFGQSIRFGSYDDNRDNDKGYNSSFGGYKDYRGDGTKYSVGGKEYEQGGGNPMILIRNRQRPLTKANTSQKPYENLPAVVGTTEEKNVGGYIVEDVNNDGSSIHMTSGTTVSTFKTNCSKQMWGNTSEEQPGFNGDTLFKFPVLMGDQIVINSDRLILSAKTGETFQYSKKRHAIVTDDEFTLDAQNQIVFTTNNKTVLNSPAIYLGEYNQTNEPVLLGQTSVNWMYDLCQWLLTHTHWYKHTHPSAGDAKPDKTQITVQTASLIVLRDKLNSLMSRRVFVVGGGFAPGKNGSTIKNGVPPVVVTLPSGDGVPGGFTGVNKKTSASEKQEKQDTIETANAAALKADKASKQAKLDADATKSIAKEAVKTASPSRDRIVRKAAVEATTAAKSVDKSVKESETFASESKLAATETTTTTNNISAIESKTNAVSDSNKAVESAGKVAAQKAKAEQSLATVKAGREAELQTQTRQNRRPL